MLANRVYYYFFACLIHFKVLVMDVKSLFTIFVAIVMIGSIVGITAFYSFPDQDSGDGEPVGPASPVAIDFEAGGVEAKVFQLLPSIRIQAETEETDIIAVNTSVYEIEGVRNVSGVFQQWDYTSLGTGYVYIATVSFEAGLSYAEILEKLEEETSLRNIDGYSFALLELPKTVAMKSVNKTLDLTRDYTFVENISEAMVEFGSLEGDVLKASVTATFVGENATNVMAIEEKNLTAEPVRKSISLQLPIGSLESILEFETGLPYSGLDTVSDIETELEALAGIEDAEVLLLAPEPVLSVSGSEVVSETAFSEIKSFLDELEAEVSLQENPFEATIVFTEGIGSGAFEQNKLDVEQKLSGLSIAAVVKEAEGKISGKVVLASPDSGPNAFDLKELFDSKGLQLGLLELMQPAQLTVDSIGGMQDEKMHPVESGLLQAVLLPGHDLGDIVPVEVELVLVRNELSSASAVEVVSN